MISVQHVSMSFPGVKALDDVTFDIRSGEVHGLVGENGAGKSTLIKILSGIWSDYTGTVAFDGVPPGSAPCTMPSATAWRPSSRSSP